MKSVLILSITLMLASTTALADHGIEELSWLQGQWAAVDGDNKTVEQFTGADGGVILGVSKITKGSDLDFFEFMRIEKENGQILFKPLPFGRPGVFFTATDMAPFFVVFENLANDFPKRIVYQRESERLRIQVVGERNGQPINMEFVLEKTNF